MSAPNSNLKAAKTILAKMAAETEDLALAANGPIFNSQFSILPSAYPTISNHIKDNPPK